MYTLGINYSGVHESSACLVRDDEIVFATAEERLSRTKFDSRFPRRAIRAALEHAGIAPGDLAATGFTFPDPTVEFAHDLCNLVVGRVRRSRWHLGSPVLRWISRMREQGGRKPLLRLFGAPVHGPIRFYSHHQTHALSAAAVSGFSEAVVLVADGRGARMATSIWIWRDGQLTRIDAKTFPDSVGLFYARVTQYLGFEPFADEWKVMGLAAYGRPKYSMDPFIRVDEADYCVNGRALLGTEFPDLSALTKVLGPPRRLDEPITNRHRDIAYAAQDACEEAMLALVRRATALTGLRRLCLAGGVAMNVKGNARILASGVVDDLFVQPAASDEGTALGAAIAAQQSIGGTGVLKPMRHVYLGQEVGHLEICAALDTYKLAHTTVDDPADAAAARLAAGLVIGWFQGRTEFGPRALGNRSILGDPRSVETRDRVNRAVKFREAWRPFAPAVLEEDAERYFQGCRYAPFMLLTFPVLPNAVDQIPAIVHADGTARVQTVSRVEQPLFWKLIDAFRARTGVPVVLNTSFNLKGDPIVNTVKEAVETFYTSGLDSLVIGNCVVDKPASAVPMGSSEHSRPVGL